MVRVFSRVRTTTVRTGYHYRGDLARLREWLHANLGPQHIRWDLKEGQWFVDVRTTNEEDDILVLMAWG
jgi:hypothetical protein